MSRNDENSVNSDTQTSNSLVSANASNSPHNASPRQRKKIFIERQFENAGLRPIHIPAGLLLFNGMLWVEWLGILVLSVKYAPMRRLMRTQPKMMRFHNRLQQYRLYNRLESWTTKSADKMATNHFMLRMGRWLNTTPDNLTYGMLETIIVYNTSLLVFAPVNFVSSVVILRYYFGNKNPSDNSGNNGSDTGSGNDANNTNNATHEANDSMANTDSATNNFEHNTSHSSHSSHSSLSTRSVSVDAHGSNSMNRMNFQGMGSYPKLRADFGDFRRHLGVRRVGNKTGIFALNGSSLFNNLNKYENHRAIEAFFELNRFKENRMSQMSQMHGMERNDTGMFEGTYFRLLCDLSKYPFNMASTLLTPLKQDKIELETSGVVRNGQNCVSFVNNLVGYCKRTMFGMSGLSRLSRVHGNGKEIVCTTGQDEWSRSNNYVAKMNLDRNETDLNENRWYGSKVMGKKLLSMTNFDKVSSRYF